MKTDSHKHKNILIFIIILVLVIFFGYTGIILYTTWPISEFSINKAGGFGDSFGIITALFSGLAFMGVLYTITLQREELELTRVELKKTADASVKQADYFTRQQKREDLHRLLLKLRGRIDSIYRNEQTQSGQTLQWVVMNYIKSAQNKNIIKFNQEINDQSTSTFKIIERIEEDLLVFMQTLKSYEKESGESENSSPLVDYYRLEFKNLIIMLHEMSVIKISLYDYYIDIRETEIAE